MIALATLLGCSYPEHPWVAGACMIFVTCTAAQAMGRIWNAEPEEDDDGPLPP